MSKKFTGKNKPGKKPAPSPALWLMAGGALVIVVALVLALGGRPAPRMVVDKEVIDFGPVAMNTPVTASFTITNQGEDTLEFTAAPYVEVLEGC